MRRPASGSFLPMSATRPLPRSSPDPDRRGRLASPTSRPSSELSPSPSSPPLRAPLSPPSPAGPCPRGSGPFLLFITPVPWLPWLPWLPGSLGNLKLGSTSSSSAHFGGWDTVCAAATRPRPPSRGHLPEVETPRRPVSHACSKHSMACRGCRDPPQPWYSMRIAGEKPRDGHTGHTALRHCSFLLVVIRRL